MAAHSRDEDGEVSGATPGTAPGTAPDTAQRTARGVTSVSSRTACVLVSLVEPAWSSSGAVFEGAAASSAWSVGVAYAWHDWRHTCAVEGCARASDEAIVGLAYVCERADCGRCVRGGLRGGGSVATIGAERVMSGVSSSMDGSSTGLSSRSGNT
eukprot:5497912-Pleurochrysis_carterae.AAC.1